MFEYFMSPYGIWFPMALAAVVVAIIADVTNWYYKRRDQRRDQRREHLLRRMNR